MTMRDGVTLAVVMVALGACGTSSRSQPTSPPTTTPTTPTTPPPPPTPPPSAGACGPLVVEPAATDAGFGGTFRGARYGWYDRACAPRSAFLVDNDAVDPGRAHGGYLYRYLLEVDGAPVDAHGTMSSDLKYGGFGFVIDHCAGPNGGFSSHGAAGEHRVVFAGANHAIHEFRWRADIDGGSHPVTWTVQWLFATGRDEPLYAITFDLSANPPDTVFCDSRSPYGSLTYDGVDGRTAGVGWGDSYRFRTTDSVPMSLDSPWDYRAPNAVPHSLTWSFDADAEMGIVGTRTVMQQPAGFDFGGVRNCRGLTSSDDPSRFGTGPGQCTLSDGHRMPFYGDWTYQMNAWNIASGQKAKKVTWATPAGAVGRAAYGYTPWGTAKAAGHPFQSYSVLLGIGKHTAHPVDALVAQMERVQAAVLTASVGAVAARGPAGVGRADLVAYAPAGWNPVYAAWELDADANRITAELDAAGGALDAPLFLVDGWSSPSGPTRVTLDGVPLAEGTGFFSSVDAAGRRLWLTLAGSHAGRRTLHVE